MVEAVPDSEAILHRFNKLIQELLRGDLNRNTFRPWEVDLLLDIDECTFKEGTSRETLRRYQRAVQRSMEKGAPAPMKLSQYLDQNKARRVM